ncbi:hypothetical protein CVT25_013874 [Psilocybe cyanescens]|uniref:SHSP domain-containing protein n=1 Tax=Psilocybe cyanescens TaxID=93625 RepID=A0A409XGC9_PSICY|nr:hypothetical protein CVT25_013874 [Psilocybe cyanescens]
MSIARQLLREMRPLFRMLDEPFSRSSPLHGNLPSLTRMDPFQEVFTRPAIDVSDEGDKYKVDADLPGVPKENVEVRIGDNGRSITIEGKIVEKEEYRSQKASEKVNSSTSDSKAVAKSDEGSTQLSTERPFTRNVSFTRTVWLPKPVDTKHVSAKMEHGVLTITVNKTLDKASTVVTID